MPRQAAIQGKTLEIVSQVLLLTLLPRTLGPQEFGRFTLALAVVTLTSVGVSLGAPSAFARFVPAEMPERRAALSRVMTRALLPTRALQLGILAVIGAALVYVAPARFAAIDIALVFAALAAEVVALLGSQVALGIGRTWVWSFRVSVRNFAMLLAVPLLFRLGGPVGALFGLLVASGAGLVFAASQVAGLLRHADDNSVVPKGSGRYGIVTGLGALVSQGMYRGPVLALSAMAASGVQTGFAALAGNVAMSMMLAVREVFVVSLPEHVERWARNRESAVVVVRRLGWWSQLWLTAGALAGVPLLDRALPIVAGQQFAGAVPAFVPILALLPLLSVSILAWQAAALELRPMLALMLNFIALVTFIVVAVFLVPSWSATGASMALLIAVALSAIASAWMLPRVVTPAFPTVGVMGSIATLLFARTLGIL